MDKTNILDLQVRDSNYTLKMTIALQEDGFIK